MVSPELRPALKIAVTGIDGAGKSTTVDRIASDLSVEHRVVHASSRPVYSIVEGQKRYHYRALISLVDKIHGLADRSRNPNLVCSVNAAHVVLQGRVIEPTLIKKVNPSLIMGARDLLVDPSVYAIFYSRRLASKEMAERIDFLQDLIGVEPRDVIFFLTVSPQEAVRRIESRIEGEQGHLNTVDRAKWRHMHENNFQLDQLQREYYLALDEVQKRSHTDVIEIDTTAMTQEEVSNLIKKRIASHPSNGQTLKPAFTLAS